MNVGLECLLIEALYFRGIGFHKAKDRVKQIYGHGLGGRDGVPGTTQAVMGPVPVDFKSVPKKARNESYQGILSFEQKREAQVLAALADFPTGAMAPVLAEHMGLETYVVRPRLTTLHKNGRVRVIGRAFYAPTQRTISIYALPANQ